MARSQVRIQTAVISGNRIEIPAPAGLAVGDPVEVVILTDSLPAPARSAFLSDILSSLPPGRGLFSSGDQVDAYLRAERDSWE